MEIRCAWRSSGRPTARGGAAGLLLGVLVAVGVSSPAAAAPVDVDPRSLVRGADAKVAYLQDGVIKAHGRSLRVGLEPEHGLQVMLGVSGKDRLVATARKGYVKVHRIRRGKAPRLVPRASESYNVSRSVGVRLSRGGKYLIWTENNRGGTLTWGRRVSDGSTVGLEDPIGGDLPLDAAGRRVLVAGYADPELEQRPATIIWRAPETGEDGSQEVVAARRSSGGFISSDIVFLRSGGAGRFGPTSLSAPGTPPWSARFTPLDLSPNGKRVLGVATGRHKGRDVLELRRMRDGKVLRSWTYGPRAASSGVDREQSARFESDTRVVFEVTRGERSALVRCRTTGRCTRASRLGGTVSFSHENFIWSPWSW